MSESHSPSGGESHAPSAPPRRGPTTDLDPSGQVTQKEPDRAERQFLNYAFFKLDPSFRRLPADERESATRQFETLIERWSSREDFLMRTYSLVGLRADVDFMLWRISNDVGCFQDMQAELNRTTLGAYLQQPYSYLALQKRSMYVNRIEGSGHGLEMLPGEGKYLFVYPFIKTRAWYDLSPHARQGMMDEHISAAGPFKDVRINTSYSYGIDDQEFVVSFDCDYPQEFVDLVGRLRYTEASLYTLRDTPMFTCAKADIATILSQLA
jgi:chlorite dismutase